MVTVQSARPHPPRPTVVYVKELTALDTSRQREILREWLARSELDSPSSLADDYEEFVITAVRDLPKAAPSGLSPQAAEAARKQPAWTFAVGALPLVVVLVFALAHVGRRSAPPTSTVSTKAPATVVLETPRSQPAAVAAPARTVQPIVAPPQKVLLIRAAATVPPTIAAPVPAPVAAPVAAPVPDTTELLANSEFGDRK